MKTDIFIMHLETAQDLQKIALEAGFAMTLRQAHEAWWEHSQDFCAEWLIPDAVSGRQELLVAARKYFARLEGKYGLGPKQTEPHENPRP